MYATYVFGMLPADDEAQDVLTHPLIAKHVADGPVLRGITPQRTMLDRAS